MINILEVPYQSIIVETEEGEELILSQGDKVSFVTENDGEEKIGIIIGFKGSKPEKVEVEIIPSGENHREIWKVADMVEGSLKLVVDEAENNDEEEMEE